MRAVLVFLALGGFWAGLSGETTPWLVLAGVATCAACTWLALRLGANEEAWSPLDMARAVVVYLPWLLWQTALSNLRLVPIVWAPRPAIQPRLARVPDHLRTSFGRALYANSITLTPGTVTVSLDRGSVLVHALTADDADGLQEAAMQRRVAALEPAVAAPRGAAT